MRRRQLSSPHSSPTWSVPARYSDSHLPYAGPTVPNRLSYRHHSWLSESPWQPPDQCHHGKQPMHPVPTAPPACPPASTDQPRPESHFHCRYGPKPRPLPASRRSWHSSADSPSTAQQTGQSGFPVSSGYPSCSDICSPDQSSSVHPLSLRPWPCPWPSATRRRALRLHNQRQNSKPHSDKPYTDPST